MCRAGSGHRPPRPLLLGRQISVGHHSVFLYIFLQFFTCMSRKEGTTLKSGLQQYRLEPALSTWQTSCSLWSCFLFLFKIRQVLHPQPSNVSPSFYFCVGICLICESHPDVYFQSICLSFCRQGISHFGVCGDQERCRFLGRLPVQGGLRLH